MVVFVLIGLSAPAAEAQSFCVDTSVLETASPACASMAGDCGAGIHATATIPGVRDMVSEDGLGGALPLWEESLVRWNGSAWVSVSRTAHELTCHLDEVTREAGGAALSVTGYTGASIYTYNEPGQPATEADALDQVIAMSYPDARPSTTCTYDTGAFGQGCLLAGVTRHGETLAYPYDRFGFLQDGGLSYTLGKYGNRTAISYPKAITATSTQTPGPECSECSHQNTLAIRRAVNFVCRKVGDRTCRDVLREYDRKYDYDLLNCFQRRCSSPLSVVCVSENGSCGHCGGPCNNMADPTQMIFLQYFAFSDYCGPLADTVAHEMAHMCGIGADALPGAQFEENLRRAVRIGEVCGR